MTKPASFEFAMTPAAFANRIGVSRAHIYRMIAADLIKTTPTTLGQVISPAEARRISSAVERVETSKRTRVIFRLP